MSRTLPCDKIFVCMQDFKITMPQFGSSPVQFLKEVRAELKKVIWPSKQEVIKMTAIVVGVSVAIGLFIGALDFIFTKLMQIVVK